MWRNTQICYPKLPIWLTLEGHANAPAHMNETTQFQQNTKALVTRVLRAVHRAQPAALNAPVNAAAPALHTPKPVTDLAVSYTHLTLPTIYSV